MEIIVSNMIEIPNISYELQKFCEKKLTFDNPEYVKRKIKKQPIFNIEKVIRAYIYDAMSGSMFVPRGFFGDLLIALEGQKVESITSYKEFHTIDFGWNKDWKLRDYQHEALENIIHKQGVLTAPAGSGKTVMGMNYIARVGQPTVWLTHTKDLMYQALDRAQKMFKNVDDIGVIGDGTVSYGSGKLLIASCQTLQRHSILIDQINDNYGCVVIDEAHHTPSQMFMEVISKLKMRYVLGLTATPDRKDQLEFLMYLVIGPNLHAVDRKYLYEDSKLIKPEVKFIYTDFEYKSTAKTNDTAVDAGGEDLDYHDLLNCLYSDEDRLELIAQNIFNSISDKNFQLVLSDSINYAFRLQKRVIELIDENNYIGVETALVHGGLVRYSWKVVKSKGEAERMIADRIAMDYKWDNRARRYKIKVQNYTDEEFRDKQITKKERQQILQRAVERKVRILFATKLAREGLDIPHLNIAHSVSPKRGDEHNRTDGNIIEQELGRIMRPDPQNKDKQAIWYDYTDYNVGVFKTHYYTRRKVYKRLELELPKRKKTQMETVEEFLNRHDLYN